MLGSARRHRAEGRWREAIDAYHRAEQGFGSTEAGLICQTERKALAGWLEPTPMPGTDWAGVLRKAVAHDPLGAKQMAGQLPEATGKLTTGIVCLMAGQMDQARRYLNAAAESRDATSALAVAAQLWSGVAALMSGDLQGVFDIEEAADGAEAIGLGWLARLARAALVLTLRPGSMAEAEAIRVLCERDGDRWGSALIALMEGWAAVYAGENAVAILEPATDLFRRLGAGCPGSLGPVAPVAGPGSPGRGRSARRGAPGGEPGPLQWHPWGAVLSVPGPCRDRAGACRRVPGLSPRGAGGMQAGPIRHLRAARRERDHDQPQPRGPLAHHSLLWRVLDRDQGAAGRPLGDQATRPRRAPAAGGACRQRGPSRDSPDRLLARRRHRHGGAQPARGGLVAAPAPRAGRDPRCVVVSASRG